MCESGIREEEQQGAIAGRPCKNGRADRLRALKKSNVQTLSGRYRFAASLGKEIVLPYYVLSRNNEEKSRNFELFIGSALQKGGLKEFYLPAGEYARTTLRPKFGFLWGAFIGAAKEIF